MRLLVNFRLLIFYNNLKYWKENRAEITSTSSKTKMDLRNSD